MSHCSIYEHFKNYLSSCFSQPSLKWNVWHHNEYAAWKKDGFTCVMNEEIYRCSVHWHLPRHIQIRSCNPLIFPKDMAHEFKCGCSINQINWFVSRQPNTLVLKSAVFETLFESCMFSLLFLYIHFWEGRGRRLIFHGFCQDFLI